MFLLSSSDSKAFAVLASGIASVSGALTPSSGGLTFAKACDAASC